MSIDDLEHVALMPHRLAGCLRRSDGRRVSPFHTRILHPKDVHGITNHGVFPVPGGRSLVKSTLIPITFGISKLPPIYP